jgi:hypothetical protein
VSSARVRCRTCGRRAVWANVWHEDADLGGREGGRWLHATDAIRSPWQPQASSDAHLVIPEREP